MPSSSYTSVLHIEPPIVTSGDDLVSLGAFLAGRVGYNAADVLHYLNGRTVT